MADYEDKKVNDKQFTLFNNESGKSYQIPLIESKDGPNVLDIRKLYQETGLFTFDPGFTSTASCDSNITFIDGDKGAKDLSRYTGRLCDKDVLSVQGVNVYDILKRDQLVITLSALKSLEERLK